MANLLLLVDPDPHRRERYLRHAEPRLAPVEGLVTSCLTAGDFAALWAAQSRAPVSTLKTGEHAAVVWGDALTGSGSERLEAAEVALAWSTPGQAPPIFDGFYAATCFGPGGRLRVGADVLGLFPVYYATAGEVVIAGSSPELFALHPLFPPRPSLEGLVGVLLTNALFRGQSLLEGIRRLQPGHVLEWEPGGDAREVQQYRIPAPEGLDRLTFAEHVELLDHTFARAMRRHAPPGFPVGLLMSGGRDSRMLAGYLERQGNTVQALTLGWPSDHEVRCAVPVAETLGLEHRLASVAYEQFPYLAGLQARWEHLAAGFGAIHTWGTIEPLRQLPARVVIGYLRDIRELSALPAEFSEHFRLLNRRALAPALLRGLLRREVADGLVEACLEQLRQEYESCAATAAERPWRFAFAYDRRFRVGSVPWRLSFGSWPVLTVLDRRVLKVLTAIPASSLAERRAQDEILRTRFPELARLPLDRNTHDTTPLLPSPAQRATAPLLHLLRRLRGRGIVPARGVERRYYHRIYDFNGPGWQAVRRVAEPHRERLADLFDLQALDRYLPPPGTRVEMEHTILDSFGRKLLVGLMLWSAERLAGSVPLPRR